MISILVGSCIPTKIQTMSPCLNLKIQQIKLDYTHSRNGGENLPNVRQTNQKASDLPFILPPSSFQRKSHLSRLQPSPHAGPNRTDPSWIFFSSALNSRSFLCPQVPSNPIAYRSVP